MQLGQVPPGFTWIIRDLVVTSLAAASHVFTLYVVTAGQQQVDLIRSSALAVQTTTHVEIRQALNVGDTLLLYTAQGAVNGMVTAYVFEA